MNNLPIGVFDSGVGGLSIFSELVRVMPGEDYIYYGDSANLPYGNKTKEQLIKFTRDIFEFFESKKTKAVIMACNTTSAVVYNEVKDDYEFKIFPLVQTVASDIAKTGYKKIGVFATSATINSHAYRREIQKYSPDTEVFEQACPGWVEIVENGLINDEKSIKAIESNLKKMLENNPEKIILGCTHYPYLKDVLSRFTDKDMFINPSEAFAASVYGYLKNNDMLNNIRDSKREFYVTGDINSFISASALFYNVKTVKKPELPAKAI